MYFRGENSATIYIAMVRECQKVVASTFLGDREKEVCVKEKEKHCVSSLSSGNRL